jgi:hypothetical protein
MIEAAPVMAYLRMNRYGGELASILPELVVAGVLVTVVCIMATIVPLRLALRRIEMMEW